MKTKNGLLWTGFAVLVISFASCCRDMSKEKTNENVDKTEVKDESTPPVTDQDTQDVDSLNVESTGNPDATGNADAPVKEEK